MVNNTMSPYMIDVMIDHYWQRLHELKDPVGLRVVISNLLHLQGEKTKASFQFKTI